MTTDQIAAEQPLLGRTESVPPKIAAVRSAATDLEQQARELIRQRPVVAVLAAVGIGYLAARLVARGIR